MHSSLCQPPWLNISFPSLMFISSMCSEGRIISPLHKHDYFPFLSLSQMILPRHLIYEILWRFLWLIQLPPSAGSEVQTHLFRAELYRLLQVENSSSLCSWGLVFPVAGGNTELICPGAGLTSAVNAVHWLLWVMWDGYLGLTHRPKYFFFSVIFS